MTVASIHDRYTDAQIQHFYTAGYWGTDNLCDILDDRVSDSGSKVFLSDSDTTLTFAELHAKSIRLAAGLQQTGISSGDRIAVQTPNWTEFAVITLALARIGAILVPILPIYRDHDVQYILNHSQAKALFSCQSFKGYDYEAMHSRLMKDTPSVECTYLVRPTQPTSMKSIDDLYAGGQTSELRVLDGRGASADDPFAIIYTSGTTSRPKGCLHTFNTYRASANAIARAIEFTADDVQLGASPIGHTTGLISSLITPLIAGASTHLMEVWDPIDALKRIEKYQCTTTMTANTFLQMLTSIYDPKFHNANSLRVWISGGSPVSAAVMQRTRELIPSCRIVPLYGRSENLVTSIGTVSDDADKLSDTDGFAQPGTEVRIVDEHGAEVPRGDIGDIAYKGPSHMLEYFRDHEQTEKLFTADGFSRSGDLGRMDADGHVRVTGRTKDIIIRGGMNISARELEEIILEMPSVENVAVVGISDIRLGEKVCACIVPKTGSVAPSLEDVVAYLKIRGVAVPKLPQYIRIFESMPTTATGKLQKHLIRSEVEAQTTKESANMHRT